MDGHLHPYGDTGVAWPRLDLRIVGLTCPQNCPSNTLAAWLPVVVTCSCAEEPGVSNASWRAHLHACGWLWNVLRCQPGGNREGATAVAWSTPTPPPSHGFRRRCVGPVAL